MTQRFVMVSPGQPGLSSLIGTSRGQVPGWQAPPSEVILTTAGSQVVTIPPGVSLLGMVTIGGGGGAEGGDTGDGGNGGGGGACSIGRMPVVPGQQVEIGFSQAAAGSAHDASAGVGSAAYVSHPVTAEFYCRALGGTGGSTDGPGAGGATAGGTGQTKYAGGNGAAAVGTTGGGGGAGASYLAAGGHAVGGTGGTTGGGDGGDAAQPGEAGEAPGGAGAGSTYTDAPTTGGAGALGYVRITFNPDSTWPAPLA